MNHLRPRATSGAPSSKETLGAHTQKTPTAVALKPSRPGIILFRGSPSFFLVSGPQSVSLCPQLRRLNRNQGSRHMNRAAGSRNSRRGRLPTALNRFQPDHGGTACADETPSVQKLALPHYRARAPPKAGTCALPGRISAPCKGAQRTAHAPAVSGSCRLFPEF